MRKKKSVTAVVSSDLVRLLAEKWEREGRELIEEASVQPTWEGDSALRNSGAARIKCAKELRALMGKQPNE